MSAETQTSSAVQAKPVHHIQVGGVRIPIWRNEGEDSAYHKAGLPELSYFKDGQWNTAKTYGLRDLLNLVKAACLAHSEILKRNREASQAPDISPEYSDE